MLPEGRPVTSFSCRFHRQFIDSAASPRHVPGLSPGQEADMTRDRILAGAAATLVLIGTGEIHTRATPPSNISFTPVARATVPEFSVKRKDKTLDWRIGLDADQPVDVATQIVTFQPGGFSGWHTHPGPVFFTVRTGALTVYEGDDPACTPVVFAAGTGAVEAATATHSHMVRNETG